LCVLFEISGCTIPTYIYNGNINNIKGNKMNVQINQLSSIINAFESDNGIELNTSKEFSLTAHYEPEGAYWYLVLLVGAISFTLASKRQPVREFKSLDTLLKTLSSVDQGRFLVSF